jgi:hypothetical protein
VHLSAFFAELAAIESSGRVYQEWPSRQISAGRQRQLAEIIDVTAPETSWAYLILNRLRKVLSNVVTERELIQSLVKQYSISTYHTSRPTYLGWHGEALPESYDMANIDRYAAEVSRNFHLSVTLKRS